MIDTKDKEMIYSRAYRELYVIISNLTKEMKEKIPKNVIENIKYDHILFKKEIEKEYVVKKDENGNSIKIEDGIDRVSDIIEEKEEKSFLPSEIREKNIIEKFFEKITNVIKSIFS